METKGQPQESSILLIEKRPLTGAWLENQASLAAQ